MYDHLNTYNLRPTAKQQERNIVHNILYNISFPIPHPNQQPHINQSKVNHINNPTKQKWATFTCTGKETMFIPKLFNLKISLKTNNSVEFKLRPKRQYTHINNTCLSSGIYKHMCPDFGKAYVGQTGRSFTERFKEHFLSFRNNNSTSEFAQNLIEYGNFFIRWRTSCKSYVLTKMGLVWTQLKNSVFPKKP
jgi:hypothetical protein